MKEKTVAALLKSSPKVRKKDIDAINDLFESYIFRRVGTGEIWTTCCRKHRKLGAEHPIWMESHIPEPKNGWDHKGMARKNQTPCPFCGRKGTVTDIRYSGRRQNLWALHRFALIRWDGEALWIICAEAKKEYQEKDHLTFAPMINSCAFFRFGGDTVDYMVKPWYGEFRRVETTNYAEYRDPLPRPFNWSSQDGMTYSVIGAEELEESPIKYCQGKAWLEQHAEIVRFVHLAYAYPRQVEMLMKAEMEDVVWDRIERGVKHYTVLDWEAKDPKKSWKVPQQILREFLRTHEPAARKIGILELWKRENRKQKVSLEEADEAFPYLNANYGAIRLARKWGVDPIRLYRYLDGQNHCHVSAMFQAWSDYVQLGEKQGLRLYRSDVIFPANLGEAHDAVVAVRNVELARERAAEIAAIKRREKAALEAAKKAEAEYADVLRPKLEAKYAWDAGEFFIRAPESKQEIIDEGRKLQHCVGGYAERHTKGKTVILFMRRKAAPGEPWITIEMNGTEIKQIHGFRNEGLYSGTGRTAPDPREEYRAFLAPWLEWLRRGSRREKDGTPIKPKTKKEVAA